MPQPSLRTLRARVKRGAALLDAKKPNWFKRIDLEHLRMSDLYDCILGQAFPLTALEDANMKWPSAFDKGVDLLFECKGRYLDEKFDKLCASHGFWLDLTWDFWLAPTDSWGDLADCWSIAIQQRRDAIKAKQTK